MPMPSDIIVTDIAAGTVPARWVHLFEMKLGQSER